jgi:glycosyltransferase involved in cell wall biosynthesis
VKILHVTDSYLPTIGGIELHVHDLAVRQRAAGHDVAVAARSDAADAADAAHDPVRRVDRGRGPWLVHEAPDVVHAHVSIVSPFALATARRAGRAGIPTVVTVHSLWTHVGRLPELARDLWGMRHWNVTWTAVSERAADPLRDVLGVPVHVLPNAVDLDRWTPFAALPGTEPPRVLSVMRLTSVKRALPLVRTLHRVSLRTELTATVVGDGPERGPVQRYLRRHGLTDRITMTGTLARPEIRRQLEQASIFLAPAHRESFGIAALEARASGVPVVASARSGVATFIEHGTDGLLGVDDEDLAGLLVALLEDPQLRERIALHNRAVRPRYGWDTALERTSQLYEHAAATARQRARAVMRGVLVG